MSAGMRAAEIVYMMLQDDLGEFRAELQAIKSRNTATISYGFETRTYAELPTGLMVNQVYYVSNARKPGQGAGEGNGAPAIYDTATSTWRSLFDGSVLAI